MKKMLLSVSALALIVSFGARAEVAQGTVQEVQGATILVQTGDDTVQAFQVSDDTIYRAKKVAQENKSTNGRVMKKGEAYFQPMVEEDDWIELTYTPNTDDLGAAEVSQVIVYDK